MTPVMAECDECGAFSPSYPSGSEAQLWLDEHECLNIALTPCEEDDDGGARVGPRMRKVTITLTLAQADALFKCADEGLTGLADDVGAAGTHPATLRAAERALAALAVAMRGSR